MMQIQIEKKEKLASPERRLDSLARILEGTSNCTAVTCINGQFYITANEFTDKSQPKNNVQFQFVAEVMEYFKNISTQGAKDDKRRFELLTDMCIKRLSNSTHGMVKAPDEVVKTITSLIEKNIEPTKEAFKKAEIPEIEFPDAYFVYGLLHLINRDFKKIEHGILKAVVDNDFSKITKEQIIAFQSFSHKNILLEEPLPVHAELQLLSKVMQLGVNKSLHIGISKLCCFHCHYMLETANEILKNNGSELNLSFRGAHDASFEQNWNPPKIFGDGYKYSIGKTRKKTELEPEKQNIFFKIGYYSAEKFKILEPISASYRMNASLSSSDFSIEPEVILNQHIERIKKDIECLKKLNLIDSEQGKTLNTALFLCDLKSYKDLYQDFIEEDRKAIVRNFFEIFYEASQLKFVNSQEDLLKFLKDPVFSNDYVRNYFKDLDSIEGVVKYKPKETIIEESKFSISEEGNPLLTQFKMGQEKTSNKSLQQEENLEMEDVEMNYAIELSKEDLSKKNEFK